MKKIAYAVFASAAALALSACGSSDSASEGAQAENVEMPAEEAMSTADVGATPMADAPVTASDAAGIAGDAAAAAGDAAAAASAAAEAATTDAEKKM